MISEHLLASFASIAHSPDPDLAVAALMIARLESPSLDARPYLEQLEALGREAAERVRAARAGGDVPVDVDTDSFVRVSALNDYLFREQRFVGNEAQYEDPRNNFLNDVLDRRTGIPITLALVYIEVARRAGLAVEGVNFPGHFLVRCRAAHRPSRDLIIDAFHGGALLSEDACRVLFRRHAGSDAIWDDHVLRRATKPQILARMLVNLKRVYVKMHSYPQARAATDLLLAVDPAVAGELRDRGLLALHLNDYSAALRDLEAYLRLSAKASAGEDDRETQAEVWEQVKAIRRKVASLN